MSEFQDCIGGMHVIEGVYDADEEEPHNEQVIATLSGGMEITELEVRTPPDVLLYFKDLQNSLTMTSAKDIIEKYCEVDKVKDC